jgi:DNA repair exonuclease SbcCD ATPase subunit
MNGTDIFNQMLGPGKSSESPPKRAPSIERVTPGTIKRLEEQNIRYKYEEKIEFLEEELEIQKAAAEEVAAEYLATRNRATEAESKVAVLEKEFEEVKKTLSEENSSLQKEIEKLRSDLEIAQKKASEIDPAVIQELENLKKELNNVNEQKMSLEERLNIAEQTSLSSSVLLDKPTTFSITEKFPGEVREHLLSTLKEAMRSADQSGKERRAKILESILCANPPGDELTIRRDEVRDIMRNAGSVIGESSIKQLEQMGFRFISGSNHNKLDWGGVRIIIPKTPSDKRAFLNAAIDIANRVF